MHIIHLLNKTRVNSIFLDQPKPRESQDLCSEVSSILKTGDIQQVYTDFTYSMI